MKAGPPLPQEGVGGNTGIWVMKTEDIATFRCPATLDRPSWAGASARLRRWRGVILSHLEMASSLIHSSLSPEIALLGLKLGASTEMVSIFLCLESHLS